MLKKLIIIGFIIIVTLSGIFIYFIQSSHNNLFPPEYHSIHEFENSAGVKIYKILDCGQFIEENQQVLLQDVSKPLLLSTHGIEHKNEMTYDISVENCFYRVDINIPDYREINNSIINKTNLGTIYQYNSKEGHEETLIYTNTAIYRNDYVKVEI